MSEIFKGKAIYNPSGKAGEYSYWACNFYVGCSNGCTYCYLKKGRGANILGGDKPTLKKCFKNESHALEIFSKELLLNVDEIKKDGLFFSFTTDPMIKGTFKLTFEAIKICQSLNVPVKILTKSVIGIPQIMVCEFNKDLISYGFTLTGHDELEPNASTNDYRIHAMKTLSELGFKTFASIEPIIDFNSSKKMIDHISGFCDLIKVGLESGKKYDYKEANSFMHHLVNIKKPKIYIKESLRKLVDYGDFTDPYFVERDYNVFE